MLAKLGLLLSAALLTSALSGCQNTEQSSVQPEKLASSTSSVPGAPPSGSTAGPLLPFASGYGPQDVAPRASTEVASGDDPDEFNPDGVAPKAAPTPKAVPKPALTPGVVKLLKEGAKPRAELRLKPEVGDTSAVEMVMTTEIPMEVDGKKPPTGKVPPIVFGLETKVTEVSKGGDIRYTFRVYEASVRALPGIDAKVITALNRALGALVGLHGDVRVTNRGITKSTKLELPGKQNAQTQQVLAGMEQALQQLAAPLPEEAVGKGAQWTHTSTLTQNGISLSQVATYDLVKVKGQKITCKVSVVQNAPKQKVASPVGVTVDLISLSSKGGGSTKLNLDQLTPLASKMKVATKASMGLPKGQKMKMDSTLTVEMGKPKKKKKKTTTKDSTAPKPAPKTPVPSAPKAPAPTAPAPAAPAPTEP